MKRLKFEKHGMRHSPEYKAWDNMKNRCYGASALAGSHPYYAMKGVTVCERWRNSFIAFYEDMGPRPENMSLDRINSNGNYEPLNCRWANQSIQNLNRIFTNRDYPNGIWKCPNLKSNPFKVSFRKKHLGYFSTLGEAIIVRKKAEIEYGYISRR